MPALNGVNVSERSRTRTIRVDSLARVEGQEVFRALAERFPALRLETEELEYSPSIQFRSLLSLPVAWNRLPSGSPSTTLSASVTPSASASLRPTSATTRTVSPRSSTRPEAPKRPS